MAFLQNWSYFLLLFRAFSIGYFRLFCSSFCRAAASRSTPRTEARRTRHEYVGQFVLHRLGGVGMTRGVFRLLLVHPLEDLAEFANLAGQGHDQASSASGTGPSCARRRNVRGRLRAGRRLPGRRGRCVCHGDIQESFRAGGEAGPRASATPLPATILPSDEGRKIVGILHGIGGYKLSDMPSANRQPPIGFLLLPVVQEVRFTLSLLSHAGFSSRRQRCLSDVFLRGLACERRARCGRNGMKVHSETSAP